MPCLSLQTNIEISDSKKSGLLKSISQKVAGILGKPEQYMMVVVENDAAILMGGTDAAAAFIEVRSIGTISSEQARKLSETICGVLKDQLEILPSRVYLNFQGWPGDMWGHNNTTFG